MHKLGIYLEDAIWLSKSIMKPTMHTNRPCTEMVVILPFGARLVSCTTKSISIQTLSMHTEELFDWTHIFLKFGTDFLDISHTHLPFWFLFITPFLSSSLLNRYDLGTLYESCENQTSDALDAYAKALELDPNNNLVKSRIELLKNPGRNSGPPPHPQQPVPQEASATIRFASSGPGAAGGPPPGPAPHQMKVHLLF